MPLGPLGAGDQVSAVQGLLMVNATDLVIRVPFDTAPQDAAGLRDPLVAQGSLSALVLVWAELQRELPEGSPNLAH
eukprot:14292052-Alexandrium_andersonii.AAC.1